MRQQGKSPRTINAYRDSMKTFFGWCVKQKYLQENPVARVSKAKGDRKKRRRAFTKKEFEDILKISECRHLIYLTAGLSGFRKNELKQLTKEDLDPEKREWRPRAVITKARRRDTVPMLAELAKALLPRWRDLRPGEKLFPRIPRLKTLDRDLERARVLKTDDLGRHLDFHSFRYFFCTQMAQHLPIQKVRILMRHRDIQTTCNLYLDLGIQDMAESVWNLPRVFDSDADTDKEEKPPK